MAVSFKIKEPVWSNPVVIRDLRVSLRSGKVAWFLGVYLALLLLMSYLGYCSVAVSSNNSVTVSNFGQHQYPYQTAASDPIWIQQSLHQFYNVIFYSMATMIALAAPALTAMSVISEKQKLTMDLLITTPMSGLQMLTGKLLSSMAFILLILMLSLPATGLCVILGGASLKELLISYALFCLDGVIFAAVGLVFSCTAKSGIQVIFKTYSLIIAYLFFSFFVWEIASASGFSSGIASLNVVMLGAFSPICTQIIASSTLPTVIFGLSLSTPLVAFIYGIIVLHLLLNVAALRLGMYGANLVKWLRVYILVFTIITVSIFGSMISRTVMNIPSARQLHLFILEILAPTFCLVLPFLIGLLTPYNDQDEGTDIKKVDGWFRIQNAFNGQHSGALPYFGIWLIVLVASALAAFYIVPSPSSMPGLIGTHIYSPTMGMQSGAQYGVLYGAMQTAYTPFEMIKTAMIVFYFASLVYLLWSICRRMSWMAGKSAPAGSLSFVAFVFLLLLPYAVMSLSSNFVLGQIPTNNLHYIWLLYPIYDIMNIGLTCDCSSFLVYGLGAIIFGNLIYPFFIPAAPGGSGFKIGSKKARE
jgi:hypothetical protein